MGGTGSSFWPTSPAEDSESTGAHRGVADTLTSAVADWSTPQAHDATGRRSESATLADCHYSPHDLVTEAELWRTPAAGHPLKGGSHPPEKRLAGGHNLDLQDQAEFWQTSAVDSFRSRGGDRKGEMGLDQQARFWPSPAARDWRDGAASPETMNGNARPLNEIAYRWEFSLPVRLIPLGLTFWTRYRILRRLCLQLRQRLPSPYRKARSIFKLKLNPNFVDWLMGWLDGWSSADRVFSAEEMEWYRCRLRQSLRCLLGGSE